ncbi:MAG: hypothetical protein AAGA36_00430 [Pseudomonadota bacterium]
MADQSFAVFNPLNQPVHQLPWIIGFNNGPDSYGNYLGVLVSENGAILGEHICSCEGWMLSDLGIRDGTASWRHETFKEHYPDGYRMDFVSFDEAHQDMRLRNAFDLYEKGLAR